MRVVYFDCFSGISGDMALGALIDAGLRVDDLKRALGTLALGGVHIHADRVLRAGVSATKFTVHAHDDDHEHHHHHGHEHAAPDTQHPGPGTEHSAPGTHHGHAHRSLPEISGLIDG